MAAITHIEPCLKYMQTASFQKLFGKLKSIVGNPRMVTLEWVETIGAWSTVSYRRRFNQIMHKRYLGKLLLNFNADLKSKITAHATTEIISSHKPFHIYKPTHQQWFYGVCISTPLQMFWFGFWFEMQDYLIVCWMRNFIFFVHCLYNLSEC